MCEPLAKRGSRRNGTTGARPVSSIMVLVLRRFVPLIHKRGEIGCRHRSPVVSTTLQGSAAPHGRPSGLLAWYRRAGTADVCINFEPRPQARPHSKKASRNGQSEPRCPVSAKIDRRALKQKELQGIGSAFPRLLQAKFVHTRAQACTPDHAHRAPAVSPARKFSRTKPRE